MADRNDTQGCSCKCICHVHRKGYRCTNYARPGTPYCYDCISPKGCKRKANTGVITGS